MTRLIQDLERYADMLAEGELTSPDDLNCSSVMRLAAEALTQRGNQDPAAYRYMDINEPELGFWFDEEPSDVSYLQCEPLYTTPPQRTWIGLTDDEIEMIVENRRASHWEFVRQVEHILHHKNTNA